MVITLHNAQLQLNLPFTTNIIYVILHICLHNKQVVFIFLIKQSMIEERDKLFHCRMHYECQPLMVTCFTKLFFIFFNYYFFYNEHPKVVNQYINLYPIVYTKWGKCLYITQTPIVLKHFESQKHLMAKVLLLKMIKQF